VLFVQYEMRLSVLCTVCLIFAVGVKAICEDTECSPCAVKDHCYWNGNSCAAKVGEGEEQAPYIPVSCPPGEFDRYIETESLPDTVDIIHDFFTEEDATYVEVTESMETNDAKWADKPEFTAAEMQLPTAKESLLAIEQFKRDLDDRANALLSSPAETQSSFLLQTQKGKKNIIMNSRRQQKRKQEQKQRAKHFRIDSTSEHAKQLRSLLKEYKKKIGQTHKERTNVVTKAPKYPGWWQQNDADPAKLSFAFEKESGDMEILFLMYRPTVIVEDFWRASNPDQKKLIHTSLHYFSRSDSSENFRKAFKTRFEKSGKTLPVDKAEYWDDAGYAYDKCGYKKNGDWKWFDFECWVKRAVLGFYEDQSKEMKDAYALIHKVGPSHCHQEVGKTVYEIAHGSYETDYASFILLIKACNLIWNSLESTQMHVAFKVPDGAKDFGGVGDWPKVRENTIYLGTYFNDIITAMLYVTAGPKNIQFGYTGIHRSEAVTEVATKAKAEDYTWEYGSPGHRLSPVKYSSFGIRSGIYGKDDRIGYEFRTCQYAGCDKLLFLDSIVNALGSMKGDLAGTVTVPGFATITINDLNTKKANRKLTVVGFKDLFPIQGNYDTFAAALLKGVNAYCPNKCPAADTVIDATCGARESEWPFIPGVTRENGFECQGIMDTMMERYAQCYLSGLQQLVGDLAPVKAKFWSRVKSVTDSDVPATFLERMASKVVNPGCKDLRKLISDPAAAQTDATFA